MKKVVLVSILVGGLSALACESLLPKEASRRAQAETARVSQEVACQKHLRRLLDLRDEGVSCEVAKERAAAENPLCNLSFTCKPSRDAGQEAGAE